MNTTTLAITLDDRTLAVLDHEAAQSGLSRDQALKQAISLYQLVNVGVRQGFKFSFLSQSGASVGGLA